jgi:HEAT repeat protein
MNTISKLIRVAAAFSLAVCYAQVGPSVDELLRLLADDSSAAKAAGLLAGHAGDPRIVPALQARFQDSAAKSVKQPVAFALLKMKVQDQIYFDYLASFALEAINNDAPVAYLINGREQDYQHINPEFLKWCQTHDTTPEEEIRRERGEQLADLFLLTGARDKRSAPILRRGLESKHALIVNFCAAALGDLQDPADIEKIIEAAYKSDENIDPGIVMGLSYYKNPRDREEILRRLQGGRLYEQYIRALKASDKRNATEKPE